MPDWCGWHFLKEEMDLTPVGLRDSDETTFVNVDAGATGEPVGPVRKRED